MVLNNHVLIDLWLKIVNCDGMVKYKVEYKEKKELVTPQHVASLVYKKLIGKCNI